MITIKCKLLAKERDTMGYSTLVFKNLDIATFGHQYVMVVVFPNWQSRIPDIDEIGFLSYKEVIAGKDTWYCPETGEQIPYNYTNLIFFKFVKELDNSNKNVVL